MLKRIFGLGKKAEPTPPPAPRKVAQLYDKPTIPYENYFNVHFYGVSLDQAKAILEEHYLHHVAEGTTAALAVAQGKWVTVYFPREVVQGLGFNRIASQVAQQLDTWVIGYRIFAWQGMDVHYFKGMQHLDQLAYSRNEIEFEPENPAIFAALANVSAIVPRNPAQHPLDFHFTLLAALGIHDAARTWDHALQKQNDGAFPSATIVTK